MNKIWKTILNYNVSEKAYDYKILITKHANGKKLIEIKNLKIEFWNQFKRNTILENISFDIYYNEIIALLGSNGVGKTTLVNSIMGIIKYQKCSITYNNGNEPISDMISAQFKIPTRFSC